MLYLTASRKYIFIFLIFFTTLASQTSQMGIVSGKVFDKRSKESLTSVNITILNAEDDSISLATDIKGNFKFHLSPGDYRLKFEYLGYLPYIKPDVIIYPKQTTALKIELMEQPFESEAVDVVASYYKTIQVDPVKYVSFSKEEIRRSPGAGGELTRILSAMPSVTGRGEDSQDIVVRGGSPSENLFLINNIPILSSRHFETSTGHSNGPIGIINNNLIENVLFSPGGFSSKYGGYLSSVTDITYRKGGISGFRGSASFDFSGVSGIFDGSLFNKKLGYILALRRSYLDVIADALGDNSGTPQFQDIQTKLDYHLSDLNTLTFLGIYGKSSIDNTNLEKAVEKKAKNLIHLQNSSYTVGVNLSNLWSKKAYSNTSVSLSSRNYDFGVTSLKKKPFLRNDDLYKRWNVRHITDVYFSRKNTLSFGFDYQKNRSVIDAFIASDTLSNGQEIPENVIKEPFTHSYLGLFTTYFTSLSSHLKAEFGFRANYYSTKSTFYYAPRINLTYLLSLNTSLHASYGVSYQSVPDFLSVQVSAQKKLRPMESNQYVFGISHLLTPETKITFETFYKKYDYTPINSKEVDLRSYPLDTRYSSSFQFIESKGEGLSYGGELFLQKKLAVNFYGLVSFSYFRSFYNDQFGTQRSRIFDNRIVFSIIGGYKPSDDFEVSFRWSYIGRTPYTPIDISSSIQENREIRFTQNYNEGSLPPYHSLYLRFDWRVNFISSHLISYFSLWNAYAKKNITNVFWNNDYKEVVREYGFSILPVGGVTYEF